MIHTYTIDSFIGWAVVLILFGLMLRQMKETRRLHPVIRTTEKPLPSISVLIDGSSALPRDAILAAANQNGVEPQVVVGVPAAGNLDEIAALQLVHTNIEPVVLDGARPVEQLLARSNGELVLFLNASVLLDGDAVRLIVNGVVESGAGRAIAITAANPATLLSGIGTFADLTIGTGHFDASAIAAAGRIAIVDRRSEDEEHDWIDASRVATTTRATEGSLARKSFAARLLIALALVLLFTAPLVAAIMTRQFSFVVATVLGIWLRLRVSTRTGEPVENALLQPLTAAIAAVSMLTRR